jgi:hypothetical protein
MRFATVRSAPTRFALLRFAWLRRASLRLASLRSAPLRSAPLRSGTIECRSGCLGLGDNPCGLSLAAVFTRLPERWDGTPTVADPIPAIPATSVAAGQAA